MLLCLFLRYRRYEQILHRRNLGRFVSESFSKRGHCLDVPTVDLVQRTSSLHSNLKYTELLDSWKLWEVKQSTTKRIHCIAVLPMVVFYSPPWFCQTKAVTQLWPLSLKLASSPRQKRLGIDGSRRRAAVWQLGCDFVTHSMTSWADNSDNGWWGGW